jgi:hypothetical protein
LPLVVVLRGLFPDLVGDRAQAVREAGRGLGEGQRGTFGVVEALAVEQIARNARVGARPDAQVRPAVVDGLPGLLVIAGGQPVTVLAFTVANGVITSVRVLTDPERLAQIVPSWVA